MELLFIYLVPGIYYGAMIYIMQYAAAAMDYLLDTIVRYLVDTLLRYARIREIGGKIRSDRDWIDRCRQCGNIYKHNVVLKMGVHV